MSLQQLIAHTKRPGVQAIILAMATGLAQVLMAVIFLVVAKASGPAALGVATVAMAWAMIGSGIVDFGSNEYWVRELSRDQSRISELFNRLASKIVLVTFAVAAFTLVCLLVPGWRFRWPIGLALLATQLESTIQTPLRSRARVGVVSTAMLVNRAVALGVVLLLLAAGGGAMSILVATASGSLVSSVMMWFWAARHMLDGKDRFQFCNPYAGATRYGIISLSGSLQALDAPLLKSVSSAVEVGLYGAVNRWTQPIALLINAFSTASVPHVAAAGSLRQGWQAIRKSSILLVGSMAVAVGAIVFAGPLTLLLLGPEFAGSANVLRLLAIATAVVIFNQPAAMILQATGHDRLVSLILPTGVVVQLLAILVMAGHWGADGAAAAAVVAQLCMAVMLAYGLVRVTRQEDRGRRTADTEATPDLTSDANAEPGASPRRALES